ncbi:MAG: helix-turn-helix domain-containing protein [Candidatus Woesearchaeota archaeon]
MKHDFIIAVSKQPLHTESVYDPKLIRPAPVFISHEGYHIWEIASWNKKDLTPIINFAKKHYGGEILKLKEEKLSNISFTSILPELSLKQKKALELAVSQGYYDYPKKTDIHKLSKLMKISYSTFQEHLKKAEGKLLPTLFKRI